MDALLIAVVGGLVGGALAAVIGGLFALRQQTQQHEHERAMANTARIQARRQRAYEQILAVAVRAQIGVDRIEPLIGPVPDPPPPISDKAVSKLTALAAVHASKPVQEAVHEFNRAGRRFELAVPQYRFARDRLEGQEFLDAHQEMDGARAAFRSAVEELGSRMNADLAGESPSN